VGKFILRFLAVIGFFAVMFGALAGYGAYLYMRPQSEAPAAPAEIVLELDFSHLVVEQPSTLPVSLSQLVHDDAETPLFDILRAIDRAKTDPRVKGIVARMGGADAPSFVHAQEIRQALASFRESGKFTYIFAPDYGSFGLGNRSYFLASAFEHIWLQPVGSVSLTGLSIQSPFAKSALAKIGVNADFMQREEYKSFAETFTRDAFSEPARQNMTALLSNLAEQQLSGIAAARKLELAKVRELAANGPYTASEAQKAGLVTDIGYLDQMLKEAKAQSGILPERLEVSSYLAVSTPVTEPKATIGLIYAEGPIMDSADGASALGGEKTITPNRIVSAFEDAMQDDAIKAILFRIDSPGGSPTASESIRRALLRAKEAKKPVFVSMGAAAASGGYWIAMNADHIVANPATLTGSIGVVSGKFVTGDLWNKLDVKWDTITTSDNALLWSQLQPFSPQGRARMNAMLDDTYIAFTTNVSSARDIPMTQMPEIAKGRVWSGEQGIKNRLVDEIGGMQTAVLAIKQQLGLQPTDSILIKQLPPPESLEDIALKFLRNYGIQGVMLQQLYGSWTQLRPLVQPILEQAAAGPRDLSLPAGYRSLLH
jgi:protease-4